jgi:hypothetical protein
MMPSGIELVSGGRMPTDSLTRNSILFFSLDISRLTPAARLWALSFRLQSV